MPLSLADAHIELQRRLRLALIAAVEQIWKALPGYDRPDVDTWLSAVLPRVEGAQRRSVALTDQYLARAMDREPLGLNVDELTGAGVRNGTSPEDVYTRPFINVWGDLAEHKAWADAVKDGMQRASSSAATDVQLSMTHTARAVGMEDERIVGFERVPDGDACDLCLVASTQRYHTGQLAPIHSHCGCGVEPLYVERGRVIHPELLSDLKREGALDRITAQRARARGDLDLREDAPDVAIHIHGELGPVLTDAAHAFAKLPSAA